MFIRVSEAGKPSRIDIPTDLIDAIRIFPLEREVDHCGTRFSVSPIDTYAQCPRCGARVKVRAFSATTEIEDVFDAVFEWMNRPNAEGLATHRRREIEDDRDE